MRISEIIFEAAPPAPATAPMAPPPPATAPIDPMAAAPIAAAPPMPAGLDDDGTDLSSADNSVSKSKDYGSIMSVLTPLRQNLLFHHDDPQYPVDKILRSLNNLPDTQGAFTYETLKSAVASGELDSIVDKLSTDSVSGKNIIVFKKDEVEPPDDAAGTGGGTNKNVVSQMAKRAAK
jgi:hypothetical protein